MRGAALTLGLSSLALALFPQFRPFFFFDPTHPMETMDAAARRSPPACGGSPTTWP